MSSSRYLVHAEGHSEPLEGGNGDGLRVLFKILVQVGQVEILVEAAVLVGDNVKQEAAVLFVGIDMMKDHHGVRVKLGGQGLPGPLVDYVNVSLKKEVHSGVSSPSAGPARWHWEWDKTQPCHVLAHDPGVSLPPSDPLCASHAEALSKWGLSVGASLVIFLQWRGRKFGAQGLCITRKTVSEGSPRGALFTLLHLTVIPGGR